MSKIALSYRIIKNCDITCKDEGQFIHTKIDSVYEESPLSLVPQEELPEDKINIEEIRQQIRRELSIEIEKEKQEIINNAIKEAETKKQEAQKSGYELGLAQGYEQGITEAKVEANVIKQNAIRVMEQADIHVSEYFVENRINIIKLAADMAESIVHHTINASTENIVMLIKPILQQYGKTENIIITSHPDNIPYLKGNLHLLEEICTNSKFIILEDRNLEQNGCIIENEHQIADLQIKKQIEDILNDIKNLE